MKRNKVYNNIEESNYQVNISNYVFYFSSIFYLGKFQEEKEGFTKKLEGKFRSLYDFEVDLKLYSNFVLYNKIEKRGFYVKDIKSGEVIKWPNLVRFVGAIKTRTS